MDLMTPSGGTIFWTIITFVILVFILGKFAWRPILQMLDEREKRIKDSLEAAEQARMVAQKTLAEQSKILEDARKEAQDILLKTRKAAEQTKDEILTKAKKEAEQLIAKAMQDIELSREKTMDEIREMVVTLSISAAQKIIGKALDQKEQEALVSDFLSKLQKMK